MKHNIFVTVEGGVAEVCEDARNSLTQRLGTLKLSLQGLKLRDVSFEDYGCTRNTVVIPTAAVAHFETSVSALDSVVRV